MLKEAAKARPSLHMLKCYIAGNIMHWLILEPIHVIYRLMAGGVYRDLTYSDEVGLENTDL